MPELKRDAPWPGARRWPGARNRSGARRWPGARRGPGAPWLLVLSASLLGTACDMAYPEVVVVNRTAEHIQLRNLSFSGCLWNTVLAYGEATSPGRCLPGRDRVHFQKLDPRDLDAEPSGDAQVEGDGTGDGTQAIESSPAQETPLWFNYQTLSVRRVDYGDFVVLEVTLDDMEEDFSVPGPYGH